MFLINVRSIKCEYFPHQKQSAMKRNFINIEDFDDDDVEENLDDVYEKDEKNKYLIKRGAIIYLIDARKKMFQPSFEEDKLPFISCLESVRRAIRTKIFRLEKCFCSIILLGTKKSENVLKLNNIYVLEELNLLGVSHVKQIDEIIKAVENSTFEKEYGCDNFSLGDAFWLSSYLFNQRSKDLNKSILLFTNDDNSVKHDSSDESRAVASAQDMFKSAVIFDLIPLSENFDVNKFYKKIICASKNDSQAVIPQSYTNVKDIVKAITKVNYRHVSLVKLPFVISDKFQIGVSVHFLVRKTKVPFKIRLSKATNEVVVTKTQYFEEETGSVVPKDDLIKSQSVAQKDIKFKPSELRAIQDFGKRELRLLGFKPASALRLENFIKPCAFIYPDESVFKGSRVFFAALLKRCIAKQVVPICLFCPRPTSSYRFVALIGQEEVLRHDGTQELPPGFIVFFLPFVEEVRTIEDKPTVETAKPEQIQLATKLIKKLKFNYKVECFQNPKLQFHWAAIEALALDLKEPEEVNDSTFPNYDLMSQRSGDIAKEFMDAVYEEDYEPEESSASKKPRPQLDKVYESGEADVERLVMMGEGERLTNDILKNYLKSIGINKGISKMRKSDLLDKVQEHLKLK